MTDSTLDDLRRIYAESWTIAVVGASNDASKAAHRIPAYLMEQGYAVKPVNPRGGDILGVPAVASLDELNEAPDVVNVFRPSDEAPGIAEQAVRIGAKVLWLQEGIVSEEARRIAEEGGLTVVMDRCMGATHEKLGLGPVSR